MRLGEGLVFPFHFGFFPSNMGPSVTSYQKRGPKEWAYGLHGGYFCVKLKSLCFFCVEGVTRKCSWHDSELILGICQVDYMMWIVELHLKVSVSNHLEETGCVSHRSLDVFFQGELLLTLPSVMDGGSVAVGFTGRNFQWEVGRVRKLHKVHGLVDKVHFSRQGYRYIGITHSPLTNWGEESKGCRPAEQGPFPTCRGTLKRR